MTKRSKIINYTMALLSTFMAIFLYFFLASNLAAGERLIISSIVLLAPVLIALSFAIFNRKFFSRIYLIVSSLVLGFSGFVVISRLGKPIIGNTGNSAWYMKGNGKDTIMQQYSAIKYYESKLGHSYTPVFIENKYVEDSLNKKHQYIIKQIYRMGDKQGDNYYMAKVLVSDSFLFTKEFYDEQVDPESKLFEQEFNSSYLNFILANKALEK